MRKTIWPLALCLLLSGCGAPAEEALPEESGPPVQVIESEEAGWREVYVKFLEDLCEEEKAVLNIDRPDYDPNNYSVEVSNLSDSYLLYDMDWDGVPELILRCGWDSWDTRFYTVRDEETVEAGRLESRYISFFTSPDQPGIVVRETPKGPVYVYRLTLEDGELRQGEYLYETDISVRLWDDTFRMEDVVPGAMYLMGWRTMVEWPEHAPLTLPIFDCGREEETAEPDPVRDEAARSLISAALEDRAEFCAVSGDGWDNNAGWTTLADCLQPGGISKYAEKPLIPRRRAWVDLDRDGQRECVLHIEMAEDDYIHSAWFVIFSEQEKAVYAYCLDSFDGMNVNTDGVFFNSWYLEEGYDGGVWRVSFRENQCYQYSAVYDETVPTVEWEAFG